MPEEIRLSEKIEKWKKEYEWVRDFFETRKGEIEEKGFVLLEEMPEDPEKRERGKIYSMNHYKTFSIMRIDDGPRGKREVTPEVYISIKPYSDIWERQGIARLLLGDYKVMALEYSIGVRSPDLYPMIQEFAGMWEKRLRKINRISKVVIRRSF